MPAAHPGPRFARIRRAIAVVGIVLLGAALAIAPVAAFVGGMEVVSRLGLAGVALIVLSAAWRLTSAEPSSDAQEDTRDAEGADRRDDEPR